MSSRIYNKIYVNKNRTEGSEKILLGYQHDGRDIVLKKDQETYFHVPDYTKQILLSDSLLIVNGATGGPFPAASDRIFKDKRNYGNVTPSGNPSDIADGIWFCSWLYKDEAGNLKWLDRYYNPGKLIYSIASQQLSEGPSYIINNPAFRDVPTTMVFDPGVLYRYFHVGEKTAQEIITTFGGVSAEHILANLNGWGTNQIDSSLNNLQVSIVTNATNEELYAVPADPERVSQPTLNFNNSKDIKASVTFSDVFNPTEEFTVSFWAQSNNWHSTQTTQLVGNYSARGGFGLFVETLSSYPYFIIPETGYGHLLFVNESGNGFRDKSVQLKSGLSATPEFIAIDMDNNIIVANNDGTSIITKYNNTGRVIASTLLNTPRFNYLSESEKVLQLICGPNNEINVVTEVALYTFDTYLNLLQTLPRSSTANTVAAYQFNLLDSQSELLLHDNTYDVKYIEQQQWTLSATDGNLYVKNSTETNQVLFAKPINGGTKLQIDPYNRLWVMHDTNSISVYSSTAEALSDPVFSIKVGKNLVYANKSLGFFCSYDRTTQTRTWKAVVYNSNNWNQEQDLNYYILDMDGNLTQTFSLKSLFNATTLTTLNQKDEFFQFLGKGDFTGYEHKRIFNQLSPYNKQTQLVLRTSLKNKTKEDLTFKQFQARIGVGDWNKSSWHHFMIVLKNRVFKVYVNGSLALESSYTGEYELSYELRPPFYIGTPVGSQSGFNQEIGYTSSIFNGVFQDIKIYNYSLQPFSSELFIRASAKAQNLLWSIPVPSIQYIEKIERMFKHKLPGAKSPFYKIKISGSNITDSTTQKIIEQQIKEIILKLQPAYVDLLSIHWID